MSYSVSVISSLRTSRIIDGNVLSIYVETFQFGEDCAEGHWWFILELNIEEMKNVEFVKINKENVEIISGSKNKEMWHFVVNL